MPVQPRIPSVREIIDRRNRSPSTFTFPRDMDVFPHKTVMIFNKYSLPGDYGRPVVSSEAREAILTPTCSITMPVPIKIYEPYDVNYSSENLGIFGAGVANVLTAPNSADIVQRLAVGAAGMVAGAAATALQSRIGGSIPGALLNRAAGAASVATGIAINPYTTARFKGVPLRQFQLNWKVSPQNTKDTEEIENIIKAVRVRMHPEPLAAIGNVTLSNILLKYPELLTFKILGSNGRNLDDYTFPTAPCFVLGFTVDRSGGDYPTFYAESGAPVVYYIQMNVMEILPLIRNGDDLELNNPLYNSSSGP